MKPCIISWLVVTLILDSCSSCRVKAIGQLETALQYGVEKNNFEHRDTAYYCYSLLAQIHGQLLKFPAAVGLMTAAMEILPENTHHSESRVANDLRLLEYWKQIVLGDVVMLH